MAIEIGALRASGSLDMASFEAGARKGRAALRMLEGGFQETSREALRQAEGMARAWDGGFKKTASAAQQQIDALTGVGRASQAASATTKRWAGELDRQSNSFDRLRASIDPVFAASKQYESAVERAESAVRSGIVSQTEANRVMEQAAQKYLGLVPAAEQAAQAEKEAASAAQSARRSYEQTRASLDPLYASSKRYEATVEQMTAAVKVGSVTQTEANKVLQLAEQRYLGTAAATETAARKARSGVSKFGLVTNQVGYQIQDVFVSGPMIGWFRAISQQAPQAAGAFSMLGGSIGSIVPWIGTAIAVGGALVPTLLDLGNASDDLEKQSKLNSEAMGDLTGALDDYSRYAEGARASTMDLIEEFGAFAGDVKETYEYLSGVSVKRALDALQTENFDLFSNLSDAASAISTMDDALAALERNTGLNATSEQLQTFRDNFDALEDDAYAAAQAVGLLPNEVSAIKAGFDQLRGAQTMQEIQREATEALNVIREFYPEGEKLPAALSGAVVQLKAIITSSSRAASDTNEATAQTHNWASAMAGVGAEVRAIMASLSGIGGGVLSNASKQAEIDALRAGKSIRDASVEADRFRKELEFDARREGASTWLEQQAIDLEQFQFEYGLTLDGVLDKEREAVRERERNLKKAAAASGKSTKALQNELKVLKASLNPLEAYNQELADLAKLQGVLSEDEMAKAMRNLNVELADSLPLVGDLTDSLVDGLFNGFEDGLDGIARTFEGWLKQMIGMALKNQIVLSLGITGGATVGGAAQAAGGGLGILGGGGGLLSGAGNLLGLGGGGGILGGLGSGLGGVLSGGGLGSSFANLGGLLSGASGGLGAIGAALPALGIVLGGVALLKKAFSRKFAFSALEGTVGADGFDGYSRDFYKGGLFRSDKSVYGALDGNLDTALDQQIAGISTSLLSMGDALGLGMDALDDYEGYFLSVMTSGRSQEQIANDISDHLRVASDQMAGLILGTSEFSRSGETASETLTRLGSSLISVNDALDLLGGTLFDASLSGGEMASQLADLFGGLDALNTSTATYWQGFYTEAERAEALTRRLSDEFAGLGLSLPTSRDAFRQLVDGLDLTTQGGRELYAELLGMAGALDQVLPQIGGLNGVLSDLVGEINTDLSAQISTAAEAQRAAEETARLWFRASDGLRDFIASLTGDVLGRSSTLDVSRSRYSTALTMASSGDMDAATDLSGLAQTYLGNAKNAASTELEYRKIAAQVQGQVRAVEAIAELTGTQEDRLAALYEQQVSVLGSLQGYLQTDGVTAEGIAEFRSAIGNLDGAIQETSAFEVQSIVGLGGSIDQARDAIGLSAGLFDASGRRIISEFGSLGEQIGLSLSAFVLGIPDEVDLETSALQTALRGLEDAIVADAAARERLAEIARLQQLGASAAGQISERQGIGSSIVASIEDLERRTGVQLLRNGNRDAQLSVGDQGFINYQADYFSGSSAGIAAFRAEFYGPNGLQSQIAAHNQHAVAAIQQAEALRDQLRGIGVMPAFAQGTSFAPGGFALVGEAGPEVVEVPRGSTVHPYSASRSMLDQSATVEELRRVREELHAMRSEQRQLGLSIARTNDRMLKIEKRRDALAVEVTP